MTQYEKSLTIKEYYTVDEEHDHDTFISYYPAADEAIGAAGRDWNHLTRIEQKHITITAWKVTQDNIQPDSVDDDKPWWESTSDRDERLVSYPKEEE